tara:strand:+ start:23 stop:223 length:201 start_codon:yes stop_codon:yes gene_type:complete
LYHKYIIDILYQHLSKYYQKDTTYDNYWQLQKFRNAHNQRGWRDFESHQATGVDTGEGWRVTSNEV